MAKSHEVLEMLIPAGGYIQTGTDYEGIEFVDCQPITKKQYLAGFEEYEAWKADKDAATRAAKNAILDRIGITEEEAKILLG